jgi:hypothetical protein
LLQTEIDWEHSFISEIKIIDAVDPVDGETEVTCESLYESYPPNSFEIDDLFTFDWFGLKAIRYFPIRTGGEFIPLDILCGKYGRQSTCSGETKKGFPLIQAGIL